ncbi:CHAT domain-containing protein [Nocardioides sp.]|uniref:CHAT domain-containing protein n=1 Tax=Nocardioides sp. TaxID=35761 RepID=UPI0025EB6B35|nr:CHAT domain-containing protein [Nocardioides sp.]
MPTSEELHRRGVAANNAGKYAAARRLLERALVAAQDHEIEARVESSLAHLDAETGHAAAALERCESILVRPGLSAHTVGSVRSQRAMLLMLNGLTQGAIDDFSSAIKLLDGAPDLLGRALLNRGGAHLRSQNVPAAERDFAAAASELERAGLGVERAMAQHNLGYCRLLAGDLVEALRLMDQAAPVLAPLSPVSAATCDQDRAEVLMAAGLVAEGRAALEAAAAAYGGRRLRRRQAEAELALARALQAGSPDAAVPVARRATRHFRSAGATAMASRAAAVGLAAEVTLGSIGARRRHDPAGLAADLAREGAAWDAAVVTLHHVRMLIMGGRLDDASRLLRGVAGGKRAPLSVDLLDRDVRAELAAARGRRGDAFRHLRAGLADLHAWQSSFGSLDLQTGVVGHGIRLAARGLGLAVESRRPEVLFEWSERARMLASRVQPVRAPEDEQIVADLTELREMAAEGGRRDPEREAELRQRIRERAWQHRGSGAVADPVTLPELQTALMIDTALVAYVVAADRVVALVVTAGGATWVDLGERARIDEFLGGLLPDLDVAASELPGAMAGFVRTELAHRLSSLADVLVTPVLEAVGERAVVLTPSGVLAGVPWTLLPGFVGRPVTVAQSATSWLARRTTPLRLGSAGFVAGPRVARAEDEVIAAAKEWKDARVLTGTDASAAAVSELAASVDVLHVAAHGRHAAENAMFSGLQLADGPWFGYDIDQLRQVPDVVVLSACEVGRSTVRWGDELIGMATAWLHAGARCVVASAAAVNDRAAYDVLVAVHQQLAAGVDPAVALAAAVPAVTADSAPVPLVCFG